MKRLVSINGSVTDSGVISCFSIFIIYFAINQEKYFKDKKEFIENWSALIIERFKAST